MRRNEPHALAAPSADSVCTDRRTATDDLDYSSGISLLSLKNHLLLSYMQHLVALFSLKLSSESLTGSEQAKGVVAHLVKLRVVLEKIAPLEQKLKYQIEKLVRKADQFDDQGAQNEEEVLNGEYTRCPAPLLQLTATDTPNPARSLQTRWHSDRIRQTSYSTERCRRTKTRKRRNSAPGSTARRGSPRCLMSKRPPKVRIVSEVPNKSSYSPFVSSAGKKKREAAQQNSHLLSDMSHSMLSGTPYAEATSGLSVSYDPSLKSGAKARLDKILEYETSNFRRLGKSKKDERDRRRMEEEVAFGGLGAGKGGKRRLGGFGAEFDDLLGHGADGTTSRKGEKRKAAAYEQMAGFKKPKVARPERDFDGRSSSGISGDGAGGGQKRTKSKFDKAVKRANAKRS